jgi:hypothetical protein
MNLPLGTPENNMDLDLSHSLAMLRTSGAYAHRTYACEGGYMTCKPLVVASILATMVHIHHLLLEYKPLNAARECGVTFFSNIFR